MPKTQAFLSRPPLGWPHTAKRVRTRSNPSTETPEHSAALFLLSLSCPHAAIDGRQTFIHAPSPPTPPPAEAEEVDMMPDHGRGKGSHECSICPKKFRSGRALGGHMKSHLERDLKGRIVKQKIKKISSLGLGFELGIRLESSPFSRTLQTFSGESIEEKMNREVAHD